MSSVRSRTSGAFSIADGSEGKTRCNCSSYDSPQPGKGIRTGTVKQTFDTVPSRWPKKKADGSFGWKQPEYFETITATAGGSGSGYTRTDKRTCAACPNSDTSVKIQRFGYFIGYSGGRLSTTFESAFSAGEVADLVSEATNAALAKVGKPEVEGLVFLGELSSTLRLIQDPLNGIREEVDRFGQKLKAGKLSTYGGKAISSAYLAFIFGVMPLINDVNGALRALRRQTTGIQLARSYVDDTKSITAVVDSTYYGIDKITWRTVTDSEIRVIAGVGWEAEMALSDQFGVKFNNVPSALWELIPMSFIIDWVYNVGNVISALTAYTRGTIHGGYTTVVEDVNIVKTAIAHTSVSTSWTITSACADVDTMNFKRIHRVPSDPSVSLPTFRMAVNGTKIVTLAALILQRMRAIDVQFLRKVNLRAMKTKAW